MLDVYKRIRELRVAAGLSQEELAKRTGYTDRSSIAKIEAGKVDLTQSKIVAFAKALDTTTSYLMSGMSEPEETDSSPDIPPGFIPLPETRKVPLVGRIACGTPITAEENIEDYVDAPKDRRVDFALLCEGDSMIDVSIRRALHATWATGNRALLEDVIGRPLPCPPSGVRFLAAARHYLAAQRR